MTNHTKTPWEIGKKKNRYSIVGEAQKIILKAHGIKYEFDALSIGSSTNQIAIIPLDESSEANAQFIVTACNSHDELISTLQNALVSIQIMSLPVTGPNVATNEDILKIMKESFEQALKKAQVQ